VARMSLRARVVGACLTVAGAASAQGADRADELFREGNKAFAAGDARTAYEAYRGAWALRKSFDIACNLGRTEAELQLSRDAAEHLDYCLKTYPASSRDELREANRRFRELFAEVRAKVAALRIETRPPGAEVAVDGASYGTTPLAGDVFVDPGKHRVRAELSGFDGEERTIEVTAGASLTVSFLLGRAHEASRGQAAPAPTPLPPSPPLGSNERRSATLRTTVVISGSALTLIGLGVGTGFYLDARATSDRIGRIGRALERGSAREACSGSSPPPDCAQLSDEVAHEKSARKSAGVAYTASVLVGVATLAAWLVLPDDADGTSARVLPVAAPSFAGLAVSGRY
jgi:hypothetical protein